MTTSNGVAGRLRERAKYLRGSVASNPLYDEAADRIEVLERELAEARSRADACEREAVQWKGEAMAHKSSLHEAYQVLTGATGEPANWNGARPFRQFKQRDRDAFMVWVRRWARARYGKWITHNTARGAFNDFEAERSTLMRETLASISIVSPAKTSTGE